MITHQIQRYQVTKNQRLTRRGALLGGTRVNMAKAGPVWVVVGRVGNRETTRIIRRA